MEMECLVRTQVQSQGIASLTAEGDVVSKMKLKEADQAQTLEDRDDLGLCLLRGQSIQEEVNVRGWESGAVEIFAKGPLGSLSGVGDW